MIFEPCESLGGKETGLFIRLFICFVSFCFYIDFHIFNENSLFITQKMAFFLDLS